jgi:hypothetical protein
VVLPGLAPADLEARWLASLEAIEGAGKPEDRQALLDHLRRFVGARDGKDAARDPILAALRGDRARRATKVEPLPVADAEEAERRRVEQLENLIRRDAVGLLGAIDRSVVWLAVHQAEDGRISEGAAAERCGDGKHVPRCVPERKDDPYALATTGLSVLAFLDFRDQDARGLLEPYLAAGIGWLLKAQRPNGSFPGGGQLYATAIALMALGQAAASTGSEVVRAAALRGLEHLARSPGFRGGYRYTVGADADLSVSAWVAQAVEACLAGGVEVPRELPWNLRGFLDAIRVPPHGYAYLPGRGASPTLAPAGMLTEKILGRPEEASLAAWRAWLAKPPFAPKVGPPLYTQYYGVRLAILLDGGIPEPWRTWTFRLAASQAKEGSPSGSWSPQGDRWFERCGRVGRTAFAVLTLEHALYLR